MHPRAPLRWLSLALLLALPAGCGGAAEPAKEIVVNAKDFRYTPDRITLKVGEKVRIKLVNNDAVDHDVSAAAVMQIGIGQAAMAHAGHSAPKAGAAEPLHLHTAANAEAMLEITPQNKGTYELFCTVEGHKAQGMVGTLVVE